MVVSTAAAATAAKFIATRAVKLVAVKGVKSVVRRVVTKSGRKVATKKIGGASARELAKRQSVSADRLLKSKTSLLSRTNTSSKLAARQAESPAAKRLTLHKLKTQVRSVRDDLRSAADAVNDISSSAKKLLDDPKVQQARTHLERLNRVRGLVARASDAARSQDVVSVADAGSMLRLPASPGIARGPVEKEAVYEQGRGVEPSTVWEPEFAAEVDEVRVLALEVSGFIVEIRLGLTAVEIPAAQSASGVVLEQLLDLEAWVGAESSVGYACAG